jgi:quercetin dioxygenase-like cupin family protein
MPFYRLEGMEKKGSTPHLSTGVGHGIEGEYLYFRKVYKEAGTGSKLHYHPNELFVFPLEGKINALVGKDRRIITPGTFAHIPPCARHQMKATEDGPMNYLYVKDKTWTMVGVAEDEPLPEQAPSAEEVRKKYDQGIWPGLEKDQGKSSAVIEGLGNCYYPLIESLDSPACSGKCDHWIEGHRMLFGLTELPAGYQDKSHESSHEQFMYVLYGTLVAKVDDAHDHVESGGVIHVPERSRYTLSAGGKSPARFVTVRSTERLENACKSAV